MTKPLNLSKKEWDFSLLIRKDLETQKKEELESIEKNIDKFVLTCKENNFISDEQSLKKALDEYETIYRTHGTSGAVGFYAYLSNQKDQSSNEIKALYTKLDEFDKKMENKLRFFPLALSKMQESKQNTFLESPLLKDYKHFLERLFAKGKYTLSDAEEKLIALKSGPAHERWVSVVSEFLSKQERTVYTGTKNEIKNFSEISSLINNENKVIRDSAAKAFNDILRKHKDLATEELNSILQNKKIDDELRKYTRPDHSRLISDDIDEALVDSLVTAVKKNTYISKRFYELKAKLLGQKKLAYHERNVPIGTINKSFPYPEATDFVYSTINNFDSTFGSIIKKLLEDGNIDVYPKKGKRSGAFCSDNLPSNPVYVLLNHTDKLQDVETLAHELGHATCDMMMRNQNALNYGVPMATAETHSTFFEELFFSELLKNTKDDEEKLSILMLKLQGDITSVLRQCHCYSFEQELHKEYRKKGYLSSEEIGNLFQKNMASYMGDFIEYSEDSKLWWVHWWHIRAFFYVYAYSLGALASKSMMNRYKQNPSFKENIKAFYAVGRSLSPREAFQNIGIKLDESFWISGLKETEKELNQAWDLAKKLGKIT